MSVDKEKIEKIEKKINKRIIRVIIGGVLVFEKYPDLVVRAKKWGKKVYLHLLDQYQKLKKEFGV